MPNVPVSYTHLAPALTDGFIQQLGQTRIGEHQPAARRDAIGNRVELLRHDGVIIRKRRVLEDFAMQLRNAVDRMRIRNAHIRHCLLYTSYRSNCINWGMAPLLTASPEAYALGDWVFVPGIRHAILTGKEAVSYTHLPPAQSKA